ncbi:MAG: thiamine phosphate synthase [Geminicoccaceae bacterium]
MRAAFTLGLYLVTDRELCRGRDIESVVAEAVAGGATMVQLRDDATPAAELIALARRLAELLAPANVPLIINNHVEIAAAAGAAGVHLGQTDASPRLARARLGDDAIIGLSITAADQVAAVPAGVVDYLGVGPVFATATKTDAAPPIGLGGLADVRMGCSLPIVAIGGIDRGNAAAVIAAGADGIAVVSAICSALAPRDAARELAILVAAARHKRKAG